MKKFLAFILLLIAPVSLSAEQLPEVPPGPLVLTSVKPEQFKASYWINQLPEPNKVLKTPEELKSFNEDIRAMVRDQIDIFKLPLKAKGGPVRELIERQYKQVKGRKMFRADNTVVEDSVFTDHLKPLIQSDKIPESIPTRWGAASIQTSVRALPTGMKLMEKRDDPEFDMLQFTKIKLWIPVAIYHETKDRKWFFVQAPYARGWVRSKDITIFKTRDELKKQVKNSKFVVVTGESAQLYDDSAFSKKLQRPSMGTVIPLVEKTENAFIVRLPGGGKGYIKTSSDVREGFLPYTQANVIRQAFKLLGARYGWGGMYNGRDCSGFTHDVFLTVGIDMPRGSLEQSFVGTQLGHFEWGTQDEDKKAVLDQAQGGITILRMPKHMMLYLGKVDGNYYVIHSTWAERYSMKDDSKNRLNQVVLSDLNLNGRSRVTSLFNRIVSISEIN